MTIDEIKPNDEIRNGLLIDWRPSMIRNSSLLCNSTFVLRHLPG